VKILLLIFLTSLSLLNADEKADKVKSDIKILIDATYSGNTDTVLDYTLPSIIEKMGGKDKAKETLGKTLEHLKSSNLKVESFKIVDEPIFIKTTNYEYVIIKTLTVISSNDKKAESLNFQLGQKKDGSNKWYYMEGSRVNEDTIKEFLLEFPKDYELPKTYRKKI